MKTKQLRNTPILQSELALDVYLKTLLAEVPTAVEEKINIKPSVARHTQITAEIAQKDTSLLLQKSPEHPDAIENNLNPAAVNQLSVMPEWTQNEFQALFFRVDQIILATPLTELLRTMKLDTKLINKLPGQPSWFMGLAEDQSINIGVLDTEQLVMGKNLGKKRDLASKPFTNILISKDGNWGLACDEVISIAKVFPEKVRWRALRKKRSWLIGTVIDELTAIVDLQHLVPKQTRVNLDS